MLTKFRVFRVFWAFSLIIAVSAAVFADTIRLKDGTLIKGRIVSFSGGQFTVAIGEGSRARQMSFSASEIESIQFDSPMNNPKNVAVSNRNDIEEEPQIVNTSAPATTPRVVITDSTTQTSTTATVRPNNNSKVKPVEVSVKVLADHTSNGRTNSGWVVKKGQKIRIIGDGQISLGRGKSTGPSGLSDLNDDAKLLKNVPTGALIAVIGDDNNEFIYVGSEREFTAARDGALFLGVNEGNLNDNSGAFNVRVEINP